MTGIALALAALSLVGVAPHGAARAQGPASKGPRPQAGGPAAVPPPRLRPLLDTEGKKPVPGAPDPVRLLMRMVRAGLSRPFVAREVSLSANGRETEQVIKWHPKQGMRFDAVRPNRGDVLIDNYKQSFIYTRGSEKWTTRESLLPRVNGRVKDVLRRIAAGDLRTEWVGQEIVAGRAADIVRVSPAAGAAGNSRKFWVDRQTGIRLKMEEIGAGGRTVSSSYLLSLNLSPRFGRNDFDPPADADDNGGGKDASRDPRRTFRGLDEAAAAGITPRQPGYLPPGYALRVVEAAGTDGERVTQRYGDGISVLSLVQTPRLPFGKKVQQTLGADGAGFVPLPRGDRAYLWRDAASGLNFALIGNLSDDQMKRIAASVR